MTIQKQNRAAITVVSYIGVLYAAVAVFAVTLFYSTAVDYGHRAYEYPAQHWILASGVSVVVAGLLLFAVNALLRDDTRRARSRSGSVPRS